MSKYRHRRSSSLGGHPKFPLATFGLSDVSERDVSERGDGGNNGILKSNRNAINSNIASTIPHHPTSTNATTTTNNNSGINGGIGGVGGSGGSSSSSSSNHLEEETGVRGVFNSIIVDVGRNRGSSNGGRGSGGGATGGTTTTTTNTTGTTAGRGGGGSGITTGTGIDGSLELDVWEHAPLSFNLKWLRYRSSWARLLMYLSASQTLLIILLQVLILVFGEMAQLQWAPLRRSFAVFYILLPTYGLWLTLDTVAGAISVPKLSVILSLNVTYIVYGAVQVFQILDLDVSASTSIPGLTLSQREEFFNHKKWLAAASLLLLLAFTLAFLTTFSRLFAEYSHSMYRRIGGDAELQGLYLMFEYFVVIVRLALALNGVFFLNLLIFLFETRQLEWNLTLGLFILNTVLSLVAIKYVYRGGLALLVSFCIYCGLLTSYYCFETVAFEQRTCSGCDINADVVFFTFSAIMGIVLCLLQLLVSARCARAVDTGVYLRALESHLFDRRIVQNSFLKRFFKQASRAVSTRAARRSARGVQSTRDQMANSYPFLKADMRIETVQGHGNTLARTASPNPYSQVSSFSSMIYAQKGRFDATGSLAFTSRSREALEKNTTTNDPVEVEEEDGRDSDTLQRLYSIGMRDGPAASGSAFAEVGDGVEVGNESIISNNSSSSSNRHGDAKVVVVPPLQQRNENENEGEGEGEGKGKGKGEGEGGKSEENASSSIVFRLPKPPPILTNNNFNRGNGPLPLHLHMSASTTSSFGHHGPSTSRHASPSVNNNNNNNNNNIINDNNGNVLLPGLSCMATPPPEEEEEELAYPLMGTTSVEEEVSLVRGGGYADGSGGGSTHSASSVRSLPLRNLNVAPAHEPSSLNVGVSVSRLAEVVSTTSSTTDSPNPKNGKDEGGKGQEEGHGDATTNVNRTGESKGPDASTARRICDEKLSSPRVRVSVL